MASGDALDQVLQQIDAQTAQDRAARRVPAPTQPVPPVSADGGDGRAAPSRPRGGGPSFLSTLGSAAESAANMMFPGLGSMVAGVVGHPKEATDIGTGTAAGILRSPITAAAGAADFAGDVGHAVAGPRGDIRNYQGHITPAGVSFRYDPSGSETFSQFSRDIDPLSQVGNPTANELSSNMASLAIGYGAGSGIARLSGLAGKAGAIADSLGNPVAQGAARLGLRAAGLSAVDAVIMDPETERFSNLLQNLGVHTEFTDWLAHDDQEGHLEGRFKNAVEGLGLGAATDGLLSAGRYWKARLSGDHATADAIQGELAAQHDGQVPDYQTTEVPAQEPSAKEPAYVGGWENAPDGSLRPVYEKDPLKTVGPEERAAAEDDGAQQSPPSDHQPETTGSTGGSVPPMNPKAMAAAMGDPEAAGNDIISFNVKRTPDDPGVTVGPIDRGAIRALGNDVRAWRDTAAEEGPNALDVRQPNAPGGEFKLGNIGNADDVAPLLRAVVDRLPEQGVRSDEELMRDAARASSEIGEDPAALLEAARLISGKLSDADTAMATLRTVWARAAGDLDGVASTDWDAATQVDVEKAAQRIYNMMAISKHVQDAKAGLGRGLRVNQLPDADSYLNTVAKADHAPEPTFGGPGPLPRTRQEIKDWFDLWRSTANDPEVRAALLEGTLTRLVPGPGMYLRTAFANFFTGAILSAPRTLLLNLVGPAAMSVIRNVERQSGAMVAAVNPFASASERQAARATARATVPAYLQTLGDISDSIRWAWNSASQNKQFIAPHQGTIDTQALMGPWTNDLIEAARPDAGPMTQGAYMLGNAINWFPRAVQRVNNGFDEFSRRLAYMGEVRAQALQQGLSQGLTGDDLHALVRYRLSHAVDEAGAATNTDALWESGRTTLTNPVGLPGGILRRLGGTINMIRKEVPESRYILPVFGVPANTLGEALRRLPIAAIPGVNRVLFTRTSEELAGVHGPIAQADAYGRMLTGASFLLGGILLNRMGVLTGAGPQSPTDRKVWLLEHQPYSMRVGDQWVRYDKYDVLGSLLSIPGSIVDATTNVQESQSYSDMMLSGVGALAQWFKDRAALRGAAGLLALGDDPTSSAPNVFNRTTGQLLQGFVPNAIQAPITQSVDGVQRMRRSWEDYLKAAIPGLSATLPPVRNVLGEPINRPANTVAEGVFPVTIAPAVTFKEDPVVDEIDRLYQATGYGAGADPKSLGYGFFNPRDVILENGQSLYDAGMQARQTMTINGLTLRQSLGKLFNSAEYNAAVDADPGQKVTSRGDASRGYMVEQVFNAYNKQIKAELAEASPTANRYLTAAAAKQRDDAYLRDVSAEDLANNPGLYQSHGIDGAIYSGKVREGATGALMNALRTR